MNRRLLLLTALVPLASCAKKQPSPNIIYILADDMGFGDISAYDDNAVFRTPHLDQLCRDGMSFTDSHTTSSVSTPSRYGIITGRYNWRTHLQSGIISTYADPLIESGRETVASVLSDAGYNTAVIGKWHLGLGWNRSSEKESDIIYEDLKSSPNDLGFDYSYIISASLDFPPYAFIENHSMVSPIVGSIKGNTKTRLEYHRPGAIAEGFDPHTTLETFTEKSLAYIKDKAKGDKPFFLYFPLTAPHTPIFPPAEFQGKSGTNAYGDFVLYVDDIVGRVMQQVKESGIEGETIIIFTADNGCSPNAEFDVLAKDGHSPNSIYRGTKADIFDGGHRVPFIVKWPGTVKANSKCDAPISLVSFMSTCADIVGAELPANCAEDSYSIVPLLKGKKMDVPPVILHSVSGFFAIRHGDWKFAACPHSGGWSYPTIKQYNSMKVKSPEFQLFDMTEHGGMREQSEENQYETQPEVAKEMRQMLEDAINNGSTRKGAVGKNDVDVKIYK